MALLRAFIHPYMDNVNLVDPWGARKYAVRVFKQEGFP